MSTYGTQMFTVTVTKQSLLHRVERDVHTASLQVHDAALGGYKQFNRNVKRIGDTFEVTFDATGREAASMFGKFKDDLTNGVDGVVVSYRPPAKAQHAA